MPKVVDHDAKRESLLAVCEQLFASRGYDGLSMRKLASALEVSTGTLYHYFASKEAIFDALLARAVQRDVQAVIGRLEPDAPLEERVASLRTYLLGPAAIGPRRTILLALDLRRSRPAPSTDLLLSQTLEAYQTAFALELTIEPARVEELFTFVLGVLVRSTLDPSWQAAPALDQALNRLRTGP